MRLLANDENKKGSLGYILHRISKRFIRWSVNKLAESMLKDVIKYKKDKGWINPEVELTYNLMTEMCMKQEGTAWVTEDDYNRRLWYNFRDVVCTIMDEDSYYLVKYFWFLELLFAHEKEFRIGFHKKRIYWDYERYKKEIQKELKNVREKKYGRPDTAGNNRV